jgi:hypothetical protein
LLDFNGLCNRVLQIDTSIRYVGIADHLGSLIAREYRQGLIPLSSKVETEKYTRKAIKTTGAIQGGPRVGRLQYVIGRYDHLLRATIPMIVSEGQDKFYLMFSVDEGTDIINIIEKKLFALLPKI